MLTRRLPLVAVFAVSLGAACVSAAVAREPLPLPRVFHLLGLIENLERFPLNAAMLDQCMQAGDEQCLAPYRSSREAVRRLFDAGDKAALERTLAAVSGECRASSTSPGPQSLSPWQTCRGAVASFYFFATDAEDLAILAQLRTLPPAVLRTALVDSYAYRGDWVVNRPNRARWLSFLRSSPALAGANLDAIFERAAELHTGIALLDPRTR